MTTVNMARHWGILILLVLFEQVHQGSSTFCSPCHSDRDCHGHCAVSSHIPVCDWVTFIFLREHCCVCKAVTCSSDTDCSSHSCSSGYVSKCNSQHNCHCEHEPTCNLDTDCSNHCLSGYTATCSHRKCQCSRESLQLTSCTNNRDCSHYHCSSGRTSYCRTTFLDGHCDCQECQVDSDCSQHCPSGYSRKCQSNRCECLNDRASSHCSNNSDCVNHQCSSGHTPVCSSSTRSCHCQATCNSHQDCVHMTCHHGYSVCSAAQNNTKTCVCKTTCSTQDECTNYHCSSGHQPQCYSGQCMCARKCSSDSYCIHNGYCHHGKTPRCSTHLGNICVCEECVHDSECSNFHCQPYHSPMCSNNSCSCKADTACQVDSDCSQHCPSGYSRKCQSNRCECLYDRASSHCSNDSDCVNHQCSSGHTSVCSSSTRSCHCQATCNSHHDCVHMTCHRGYSVCSAAQDNTKTCVCKTTCSTQDECTNYHCTSQYKSQCHSGQCHCTHKCTSNSYCTHYVHCDHGKRPRCSTYLGDICVCEECVHDSECSNFHCQPYHSPMCSNNSCSCKTDPVDGMWTQWGSWTSCSVTCGQGHQTRARFCTNPAPSYGGLPCSGNSSEERNCSQLSSCQVDGGWSDWMAWSTCSVSCGGGMQTRARMCGNPPPSQGGSNCVGDIYQTQTCSTVACGGLACPTCDQNLVCTYNNTCDSSETCMIRAYHNTRFTVHCSKKEDCAFEKSALSGEIYCCDDHSCLQRYLGIK